MQKIEHKTTFNLSLKGNSFSALSSPKLKGHCKEVFSAKMYLSSPEISFAKFREHKQEVIWHQA